jgi:hypothetical protein
VFLVGFIAMFFALALRSLPLMLLALALLAGIGLFAIIPT